MDPALFKIDFGVLTEILITIIVLSFFIERALSLVFEHRLYVNRISGKGLKVPIAFVLSIAVCAYWNFDALAVLLHGDAPSFWGYAITAAIIAGGSKASIKLFHDVMKVRSSAQQAQSAASNSGRK